MVTLPRPPTPKLLMPEETTISRTQAPAQIALGRLGGVADNTQPWWHWPFSALLEEELG